VGVSAATGAVVFQAPFTVGPTSWSPAYTTFLADINGDGAKDLVWNFLGTSNFVWRALSNRDGTFNTAAAAGQTHPASGWGSYVAHVGDVDRDGDDDLTWNSLAASPNRIYHGISDSTGVMSFPTPGRDHPTTCCWSGYQRVAGDFDGDQRLDLAFFASDAATRGLHRAYSNGVNAFTFPAFASNADWRAAVPNASWEPYAGDVNGDGVDDVILNTLSGGNLVRVAFGTTARTFPPPAIQPNHPASAQWSSAGTRGLLVGDTDGDGRDDIVWVVAGAVVEVYVGSGRP
jgi:hypothetical protein